MKPLYSALRAGLAVAAVFVGGITAVASGAASMARAPGPLPQHLGETGLYVAGSMSEVRPENLPFSPQYPLWSDGATKRRWLHLPPGTSIDASRPNAWQFPPGTRLWKEFSHERRVETRLIERLPDGSWRYAAYLWNDDGSDAVLAPAGGVRALPVRGAPNGRYAVPSEGDCRACHEGGAAPVLGVSDRSSASCPSQSPFSAHLPSRCCPIRRPRARPVPKARSPPPLTWRTRSCAASTSSPSPAATTATRR